MLYQLHYSYMHHDYEGLEKSKNVYVAIRIRPHTALLKRNSLWNAMIVLDSTNTLRLQSITVVPENRFKP